LRGVKCFGFIKGEVKDVSEDTGHRDEKEIRKEYEERVKRLEKKIEEIEARNGGSVVGDIVGQLLPGLGGVIKTLEKTSPEFRKRIEETDAEIKHRIDMGWSSRPVVEYNISTRPLGGGTRRGRPPGKPREISVKMPEEVPTKAPIVDVFEKDDQIFVLVVLPELEESTIETKLAGNVLEISDGNRCKRVELPERAKSIIERSYKHGVLQITIEKEDNGS
jgi:HSP20 family molecular chaperone IbpA